MNLAALLAASASRLPDKPALIFRGRAVTYRDLDARVARAAGALLGFGLAPSSAAEPGDRVAVLVGNTPEFVEALFGSLRAGLVAVPVNAGFTRAEVAAIVADAGARVVVTGEPTLPAVADLPGVEHVLVAGAAGDARPGQSWDAVVDAAEAVAVADARADDLALLQYTSGVTGQPKGVMLTHANLRANHEQLARTPLRLEERDIVMGVLPLFHIYGLNVVLGYTLAQGATVLLVERFEPLATLREVERHRGTVLASAPPMYFAWAHEPGLEALDLASVRFAVSGADALPADVLERFTSRFGITLWEGYGLTETAPVVATAATGAQPKPGSVGRPLPGVEVRLVDADGAPVRRGDPGEVVVRGPNVFSGYWRDPDATRAVLDDDGWFRTGDVAYADPDGDLHLVDRKTDLIIVRGFNVYPREVEEVLAQHPAVAQVAVVGAPHPRTGQCVKAFVVLADGAEADRDELAAFARRNLARFKVPEVVELVPALPRLPSGKVLRRSLREP